MLTCRKILCDWTLSFLTKLLLRDPNKLDEILENRSNNLNIVINFKFNTCIAEKRKVVINWKSYNFTSFTNLNYFYTRIIIFIQRTRE